MFFTIHLAPNIMLLPTISSGVLLNPNILRENIPLSLYRSIRNIGLHCMIHAHKRVGWYPIRVERLRLKLVSSMFYSF